MWLAKDNRFMNPMSTYEWNLMARCSSLHLLFVHHLLALALFLFNFLFFIIFTAKGFGDGYLLNSYSLQQILTHIIVYRLGGLTTWTVHQPGLSSGYRRFPLPSPFNLSSLVFSNYFLFILFIVVTGRILEIKREPTIKGRDVSYDPQIFEFLFLIFCIPNEISFTIISLSSSDKLFLES